MAQNIIEEKLHFFIELQDRLSKVKKKVVNQRDLFDLIIDNVNELPSWYDIAERDLPLYKKVISEIFIICKFFENEKHPLKKGKYVEYIYHELKFKVEGHDELFSFLISQYREAKSKSFFTPYFWMILAIVIVLGLVVLTNTNKPSNKEKVAETPREKYKEQNKETAPEETYDPVSEIIAKQLESPEFKLVNIKPLKVKKETPKETYNDLKKRMISEGWSFGYISNGNLANCYKVKSQISDIDNYLSVTVGSNTDVVLKLMNYANDKCYRMVYVRSNSNYEIKNIPEGRYYVKIAYGKDWISKTQNGKCIGKFLKSPLYEKGQDVMDFNLQDKGDYYNIPSFKLELDVISTSRNSSFNANSVSESEFNE